MIVDFAKYVNRQRLIRQPADPLPHPMRVMMPDGSSCRFSGQAGGDSIQGGYSCLHGGAKGEQGIWEARRR